MKKNLLLTLFLSFSLILLSPAAAFARVITVERGVVEIGADEVIDDDLFAAGETIQIDGTVNGDVYTAGETVRVNGTINGDLHAAGGTVYVSGNITQDVYLGAGNVNVTGAVIGDSLLIGAGNVSIDEATTIGGSLLSGAGNLTVFSPIKRNFFAGAGTIDLNSKVEGEARLGAGSITLGPDTVISKDLHYALSEDKEDLNISKSASVGGTINRAEHDFGNRAEMERARNQMASAANSAKLVGTIISLLGALIVGYLLLRFFPNLLAGSAQQVSTSFGKSLLVGFLITLVALPALIVLAITGIGLPLAGILFLLLLIGIYLAKFAVGLSVGQWLSLKLGWQKATPLGILALGLSAFYLIKLIPVVGFFTSLIVLWVGLGALTLQLFSIPTIKKASGR